MDNSGRLDVKPEGTEPYARGCFHGWGRVRLYDAGVMEPAVALPTDQPEARAPACRPGESRRPPCWQCGTPMEPEHAHHRCPACGYIEPCCGW
jgi:hypothetical protein